MNATKKMLAGLGGAIALNLLHESLKKGKDMPRIDLLGEEALQEGLSYADSHIENEDALYTATLLGDVASNASYYSLIGLGSPKNVWQKALGLGLAAGIGAVVLPQHIGLNPAPVARNNQVKVLTVAYYLAGVLATAAILKAISSKS